MKQFGVAVAFLILAVFVFFAFALKPAHHFYNLTITNGIPKINAPATQQINAQYCEVSTPTQIIDTFLTGSFSFILPQKIFQ